MKKLITFVLLVVLLASCKKEKDKTCAQDMAGISGTYKITAATYKASAAAAEQDYYNQLFIDACERDDLFIFNSNGTYIFTDAGVKCVPPGDDTGTWTVSGNTATLNGLVFTIQSFNCSALVILLADLNVLGDQVKFTFSRQ